MHDLLQNASDELHFIENYLKKDNELKLSASDDLDQEEQSVPPNMAPQNSQHDASPANKILKDPSTETRTVLTEPFLFAVEAKVFSSAAFGAGVRLSK